MCYHICISELGAQNIDDAKSLKMVRASMQISWAGYALKFMLPELYEPFELVGGKRSDGEV